MSDPVKILCVAGSPQVGGRTGRLLQIAADECREAGAEVRLLDLAEEVLPLLVLGDPDHNDHPMVRKVREWARWADGFVLATPEFHGGISGVLKNWFDHLWPEPAGKLAGVLSVTGGGGGDMSITAVKNSFQWCHGFTLPFHAAARGDDFDQADDLVNERVRDRVRRVARDVVRYAPVIRGAFDRAKEEGEGPASGFAGLHLAD